MESPQSHRLLAQASSDAVQPRGEVFILTLPDEILDHILKNVYELIECDQSLGHCLIFTDWVESNVDRIRQIHKAFGPITRTCQRFRRIATPYLYRSMVFQDCNSQGLSSPLLYRTIQKDASLHRFTRRLVLRHMRPNSLRDKKHFIENVASRLIQTRELTLDLRSLPLLQDTTQNVVRIVASSMHSLSTLHLYFGVGTPFAAKSLQLFRILRGTPAKDNLRHSVWHDVVLGKPPLFDGSILKEIDSMSLRTLHVVFNAHRCEELSVSSLSSHWPEGLEELRLSLPLEACTEHFRTELHESVVFRSPTAATALPAQSDFYSLDKTCNMLPLDLQTLTILVPSEPSIDTDECAFMHRLYDLIFFGALSNLRLEVGGISMASFDKLIVTLENWCLDVSVVVEQVNPESGSSSFRRIHADFLRDGGAWSYLSLAPKNELRSVRENFEEFAELSLEINLEST